MDPSPLYVFLTIAREQSFSRAAEKSYRTKPTVSIVIWKLEESNRFYILAVVSGLDPQNLAMAVGAIRFANLLCSELEMRRIASRNHRTSWHRT
jgi:hypothetical protein